MSEKNDPSGIVMISEIFHFRLGDIHNCFKLKVCESNWSVGGLIKGNTEMHFKGENIWD